MAWYEHTEPTRAEVLNVVKEQSIVKKITRIGDYDYIIQQSIDNAYKPYKSFGSWRGFYTFTLSKIMNNIREDIVIKLGEKAATKKLTNSPIIKDWVNHILYRLPEEGSSEKRGLRVDVCKHSFNRLKEGISD